MDSSSFSVTWDYLCPFARNAHEHLITALEADERRRPYRLTAQGATVLAEYFTAQQRVLKTGQARLKRSWSLA